MEMDYKGDNKISKRESLEHVMEKAPPDSKTYLSAKAQLDAAPEIPQCIVHIWEWFWDLNQTRTYDMAGPNPITYTEIQSWNFLKNIDITDIETEILKKLDTVYLTHKAEQKTIKQKKKK